MRIFPEIVRTFDCAKHFIVCEQVSYPIELLMLLTVEQSETGVVLNRGRIVTIGEGEFLYRD